MSECIFNINSIFDDFGDHSAISTLFLSKVAQRKLKLLYREMGVMNSFMDIEDILKQIKSIMRNFLNNNLKKICLLLKII